MSYIDSVCYYIDSVCYYIDSVCFYTDSMCYYIDSMSYYIDSVYYYIVSVCYFPAIAPGGLRHDFYTPEKSLNATLKASWKSGSGCFGFPWGFGCLVEQTQT